MISGITGAQTYNIVIKGGHVIDPKNNINEPMDIAVKDGKIAKGKKHRSKGRHSVLMRRNVCNTD
jgi:formylmethanofuran dehydrogenase subunit A